MNIAVIGKRAGQCGVSTVASLLSAFMSYNGKYALYIPLSEDINDVLSWYNQPLEQNIVMSITRISSFLNAGSTNPNDLQDISIKLDDKLYLLDTRAKALTDGAFMEVIEYAVQTNTRTAQGSPFDFIIWDISHERRTNLVKEFILDNADVIIDVRSQNDSIYLDDEYYLEDYKEKVIKVDNKTSPSMRNKISILDYISQTTTKRINIRMMAAIQRSQNNYVYYKCCQDIFKKPDSKGLPVLGNLKLLLKEILHKTKVKGNN